MILCGILAIASDSGSRNEVSVVALQTSSAGKNTAAARDISLLFLCLFHRKVNSVIGMF